MDERAKVLEHTQVRVYVLATRITSTAGPNIVSLPEVSVYGHPSNFNRN